MRRMKFYVSDGCRQSVLIRLINWFSLMRLPAVVVRQIDAGDGLQRAFLAGLGELILRRKDGVSYQRYRWKVISLSIYSKARITAIDSNLSSFIMYC